MSQMLSLPHDEKQAVAIVKAIQGGEVETLERLLDRFPDLAAIRIVDARGVARSLLHIVADWPGHFPNGARTVAVLIAAGADVNAAMAGPTSSHATALHWAASSGDVEVLDALLDGGANIEAPGAVFTNGPPMSDAVIFAQWRAARRLLERGATTTIWQAAALGLLDRVQRFCEAAPPPSAEYITNAFWHACRGGQRQVAEYLLDRGADVNWVGHDRKRPLDAALDSGATGLAQWLRGRGAKHADDL
jgi:ankyrin repeat protein